MMYNTNFLETPDPVTGLQRRTGQNFIDMKQTEHERRTLEHVYDPQLTSPQATHGIHRPGSAVAFVTALGAALPTHRPTGYDKAGNLIPAIPLDANDKGRLCWHEGAKLMVWTGTAWINADTTTVGALMQWPVVAAPNTYYWAKCNGTTLLQSEYPDLALVLGHVGGVITLPKIEGISTVASGNYTNFNGTGRTKGSGQLPGTLVEDQIQTLAGSVMFNPEYGGANISSNHTGIFKAKAGSGDRPSLDRVGNNTRQGMEIALSNTPTDPNYVRNGAEARASAFVVDFYIKKR